MGTDYASVAKLLANPARSAVVDALMEGRPLTAGELAQLAGVRARPSALSGSIFAFAARLAGISHARAWTGPSVSRIWPVRSAPRSPARCSIGSGCAEPAPGGAWK